MRKPGAPSSQPTSFSIGLSAESKAAAYLVAKGHRILTRRFRCALGEIDIVAFRRNTVLFIEVKARDKLDDAAYAVTPRQQQRIIGAAEAWLANNPKYAQHDCRFDAILVAPGHLPKHLTAAFDASP